MRKKPTKDELQTIFTGIGGSLKSDFGFGNKGVRPEYKFYDKVSFENEEVLDWIVDTLDLTSLSFIQESNTVCFNVGKSRITGRSVFKDAASLDDQEVAKICPQQPKEVDYSAPGQEVARGLKSMGLPVIQPVNYDELRQKAAGILLDATFLREKVLETLKTDFNFEGFSKDITALGSAWKKLTIASRVFAAASLVPLLYTAVSSFVSKSNHSSLPYLACSAALVCLSGLTVLSRNANERYCGQSIRNTINQTFRNQDAIDKLFDSIEQIER